MTNNGKLNKKTKHSNNLTVSLGRMTHVKSKTLSWMKGFEKLSTYNTAVSGSLHDTPPVQNIEKTPCAPSCLFTSTTKNNTNVLLASPVQHWTPATMASTRHAPSLSFLCSFCNAPMDLHNINVNFNAMLPVPYVLTCNSCKDDIVILFKKIKTD